jgi:uncharacterized protein YcsI (UPF0317 family)
LFLLRTAWAAIQGRSFIQFCAAARRNKCSGLAQLPTRLQPCRQVHWPCSVTNTATAMQTSAVALRSYQHSYSLADSKCTGLAQLPTRLQPCRQQVQWTCSVTNTATAMQTTSAMDLLSYQHGYSLADNKCSGLAQLPTRLQPCRQVHWPCSVTNTATAMQTSAVALLSYEHGYSHADNAMF